MKSGLPPGQRVQGRTERRGMFPGALDRGSREKETEASAGFWKFVWTGEQGEDVRRRHGSEHLRGGETGLTAPGGAEQRDPHAVGV